MMVVSWVCTVYMNVNCIEFMLESRASTEFKATSTANWAPVTPEDDDEDDDDDDETDKPSTDAIPAS